MLQNGLIKLDENLHNIELSHKTVYGMKICYTFQMMHHQNWQRTRKRLRRVNRSLSWHTRKIDRVFASAIRFLLLLLLSVGVTNSILWENWNKVTKNNTYPSVSLSTSDIIDHVFWMICPSRTREHRYFSNDANRRRYLARSLRTIIKWLFVGNLLNVCQKRRILSTTVFEFHWHAAGGEVHFCSSFASLRSISFVLVAFGIFNGRNVFVCIDSSHFLSARNVLLSHLPLYLSFS